MTERNVILAAASQRIMDSVQTCQDIPLDVAQLFLINIENIGFIPHGMDNTLLHAIHTVATQDSLQTRVTQRDRAGDAQTYLHLASTGVINAQEFPIDVTTLPCLPLHPTITANILKLAELTQIPSVLTASGLEERSIIDRNILVNKSQG